MDKITTILITHKGSEMDQAAIEGAFQWLSKQMTAADLARCDRLTAAINLDPNTRVDFNMQMDAQPPSTAPN